MTTLTQASAQWASRPADERFLSLHDMADTLGERKRRSKQITLPSYALQAGSNGQAGSLWIEGPKGGHFEPTHHALGQLAQLTGAPAHYLRELPGPIAADCLTYGLKFRRDKSKPIMALVQADPNGNGALRDGFFEAATGPQYGRIWNADVAAMLAQRFGSGDPNDGGDWTIPGEFSQALRRVTKANTTLYGSDRDMFVFLADETNRIELPNRRGGKAGSLARGFFIWNSQVGSRSFGVATFLFDYVCCNRMVWGATEYKQIVLRHSALAPERFADEVMPVLASMHHASTRPVLEAINAARDERIDDLQEWLAKRKQPEGLAQRMQARHMLEEERPVESVWDATVALTALARDVPNSDTRVELEKTAGQWLEGKGSRAHRPDGFSATELGF